MSYFLNKKNLLALIFIGIGVFMLMNSTGDQGILYKAVTDEIDPMDFPRMLLKVWIGLSILYFFAPAKPFDFNELKKKAKPLLLSMFAIVIYVSTFFHIGLFTSSFLFLILFYTIHKYKGLKKSLLIAFITAMVTWIIFVKLLNIPMPVDLILGG